MEGAGTCFLADRPAGPEDRQAVDTADTDRPVAGLSYCSLGSGRLRGGYCGSDNRGRDCCHDSTSNSSAFLSIIVADPVDIDNRTPLLHLL